MLSRLPRRSSILRARIIDTSIYSHPCIQRQHIHNTTIIRSAATAEVLEAQPVPPNEIPKTKAVPAKKVKPAASFGLAKPSPRETGIKQNQSKLSSKQSVQSEKNLSRSQMRSSAENLDSPVKWTTETILQLYQTPPESILPQKLVVGGHNYDFIENALSYLKEGLKVRVELRGNPRGKDHFRSQIILYWGKESITAIGDGSTKAMAEQNAALHAILKGHKSRVFYFAKVVRTMPKLMAPVIAANRSAKLDVYDYAAHFDVLPQFEREKIPVNQDAKAKNGHLCRVRVEGTNILGEGFNPTSEIFAEITACLDFKARAEKAHQGEKLLVKHINTLTTKTGKKFLEYCKLRSKDWAQYRFQGKQAPGGMAVVGQLFLADRLMAECAASTLADAEALCSYLAARNMKAIDPKLWKDFIGYYIEHNGEILRPVKPIGVWMNQDTIGALKNRVQRLLEVERQLENFSEVQKSLTDEVRPAFDKSDLPDQGHLLLNHDKMKAKSYDLLQRLLEYEASPRTSTMREIRAALPLNQYAQQLRQLFPNDVFVLVGATGSGKTTQVPQLILDDAIRKGRGAECNIICTQPRRIAAVSVAKRVADERYEKLGQSVGYHVRFDNHPPTWGGSITYCTTGILLRQLQEGWKALEGVSHVIVDEVHERNIQIDLLLVLLKRVLQDRLRGRPVPPVKIILMSATIDSTLFRKYFGAAFDSGECPLIEIPGRTYPVERFYLDDIQTMLQSYPEMQAQLVTDVPTNGYLAKQRQDRQNLRVLKASGKSMVEEEEDTGGIDWSSTGSAWEEEDFDLKDDTSDQPNLLIAATIAHLCKMEGDGAILVFMPGIKEILGLQDTLQEQPVLGVDFKNTTKYKIFMLHSSIPSMQQEVFLKMPGVRKIILSTNIAETSVTIPEVVFVIDTCKHREKRYSQLRRSTALLATWIAQSNANQRAGRAGRVKPGKYFALVYPERHQSLPPGSTPEIKRSDLQSVCLEIRMFGIQEPIADVLEECIEPPASVATVAAIRSLTNLGALDDQEKITPLGEVLGQLPVEPALGRMVLLGVMFKCLDPILILASMQGQTNFYVNPLDRSVEMKNSIRSAMALGQPSDHFGQLNAYREWRYLSATRGKQDGFAYAWDNLLHMGALSTIQKTSEQLLEMLVDWGMVKDIPVDFRYNHELGDPDLNVNSDVQPLISSLLAAGLQPNIAVQMNPMLLQTHTDAKALIHPTSINSNAGNTKVAREDKYIGAGPPGTIVLYSNKTFSHGGMFLRETSVIGPTTSLMFGGTVSRTDEKDVVNLNGWLPMVFEPGVTEPFLQLIECLNKYLGRTWPRLKHLKAARRSRFKEEPSFFDTDPVRDPLVKTVVEVLERCEHVEVLRRKLELERMRMSKAKRDFYGSPSKQPKKRGKIAN